MSSIFDKLLEPWQRQGAGDDYAPSPSSLRVLELSERATKEVYDQCATKDDPESRFVLLGMDGMLHSEGYLYKNFENAVKVAMQENLAIFSARTRRAVRVVWYQEQRPMRTRKNCTFEVVILQPHPAAMDLLKSSRKIRGVFYGRRSHRT